MTIFVAAYLLVALKAFQQLNVVHNQYLWVPPISLGMAAAEILIVLEVVKGEFWHTWPLMGSGAAIGAITAMYIHGRLRNGNNKNHRKGVRTPKRTTPIQQVVAANKIKGRVRLRKRKECVWYLFPERRIKKTQNKHLPGNNDNKITRSNGT